MALSRRGRLAATSKVNEEIFMCDNGEIFTISSRDATIQNGKHSILITAGATKDVYVTLDYSSEDFAEFNTYSNVVPTGGTAKSAFNRKVGSTNVPECTILKNITSFTGGQVRGEDFIGTSGAAAQRAGGTGGGTLVTVIPSGNNLLVELKRTGTGTKFTGIIVNMFERAKNGS